jgi:biopolymer transport protein ExbD
VSLPEAETAVVSETPENTVTIKSNGIVLFNGKEMDDDKLFRSLKRTLISSQSREVVILSDKEVAFGRVVEIMDISKKSGAHNISFLVERKK